MFKRLALCVLLVVALCGIGYADNWVNGGGQLILKDMGTSQAFSGGTYCSFGTELSERMIGNFSYETWKSGNVNADNGLLSLTVLSDEIVKKIHTGLYLNVGAGAGKTDTSKIDFGTLTDAGLFFNASPKCRLYLGGAYSNLSNMAVYAVKFTISINAAFK